VRYLSFVTDFFLNTFTVVIYETKVKTAC